MKVFCINCVWRTRKVEKYNHCTVPSIYNNHYDRYSVGLNFSGNCHLYKEEMTEYEVTTA